VLRLLTGKRIAETDACFLCRDLSGTKLTALNASMLEGMPSLQRLYVIELHCHMMSGGR